MKKRFLKIATLCLATIAVLVYPISTVVSAIGKAGNAVSDIITIVSPTQSAEIDLDNATVKKYYSEYTKKSSYAYYGKGDQYYMNDVTLQWQTSDAQYYQVYLSEDKFFSTAEKYLTTEPKYVLQNLIPNTEYYWKVKVTYNSGEQKTSKAYQFTTTGSVRAITIDGVSNSRDLGGAKTTDGKMMKYGLLYRSANLDSITEKGKKQLRMLGVKTELDLRGDTLTTSMIGADAKLINIKGAYYVGHSKGIEFGYDDKNEYIGYFCDELRACADANNYPMIFHCAIGRDRTGTLAAYLQMLCGVAEDDIYREFEFSNLSTAGTLDGTTTGAYDPFDAMIQQIKAKTGATLAEKAAKYAIQMGITAEDVAAIRNILLEG